MTKEDFTDIVSGSKTKSSGALKAVDEIRDEILEKVDCLNPILYRSYALRLVSYYSFLNTEYKILSAYQAVFEAEMAMKLKAKAEIDQRDYKSNVAQAEIRLLIGLENMIYIAALASKLDNIIHTLTTLAKYTNADKYE